MLRSRRLARPALIGLAVVLLAAAGTWIGLRVAQSKERVTPLGTIDVRVSASLRGSVDAYVPLADWGLRARAFDAPLTLHAEARTVNRRGALAAARGDSDVLAETETALEEGATRSLKRAWAFAAGGALAAGLIGLLALLARHERRRRLLAVIALAPAALVGVAGGGSLLAVAKTFDPGAFQHPTYYARGAELVQLLDAAARAERAGNSYVAKVEGAVRGIASLLAETSPQEPLRTAVVASDLHNNALALDSLGGLVGGEDPVFMPGDFGHEGNETEIRLIVSRLRRLGPRVVAVSGNHDSSALMRRLVEAGVVVLTEQGRLRENGSVDPDQMVVEVEGLRVAGFADPLEWTGEQTDDPRRIFSFSELPDGDAAREEAEVRLVAWFEALPEPPDVVLVHQNGLAQHLGATLAERGYRKPLTILTGHDHEQHVDGYGTITVVDGGTVGAGGVFGLGTQSIGLARAHFSAATPLLRSVDLIEVEPVSGATQAERVIIGAASCPVETPTEVCRLDSG